MEITRLIIIEEKASGSEKEGKPEEKMDYVTKIIPKGRDDLIITTTITIMRKLSYGRENVRGDRSYTSAQPNFS